MKITLDIDQLRSENKITQEEYDKLKSLSLYSTASLAFSILIGFGVVAVSAASLALIPSPYTGIFIGALILIGGILLNRLSLTQWNVLAQICIITGALMVGGGLFMVGNGDIRIFILIAAIYAISALYADSALLTVLAILSLNPLLGAGTTYQHAAYTVFIEQPALTVISFSALGIALYVGAQKVSHYFSRLGIIAARTCAFLVNMGFWIGSLWGDKFSRGIESGHPLVIPDVAFSIVWAIALILAAIWSWRANRRWLLNVVAIFAGIYFYTQWFEHLGATPSTVLFAGLIAILFALIIKYLNTHLSRQSL